MYSANIQKRSFRILVRDKHSVPEDTLLPFRSGEPTQQSRSLPHELNRNGGGPVRQGTCESHQPLARAQGRQLGQQSCARPHVRQRCHIIGFAESVGDHKLQTHRSPGFKILYRQNVKRFPALAKVFDADHVIPPGEISADLGPERQGVIPGD
jgi:hypothetical protein